MGKYSLEITLTEGRQKVEQISLSFKIKRPGADDLK